LTVVELDMKWCVIADFEMSVICHWSRLGTFSGGKEYRHLIIYGAGNPRTDSMQDSPEQIELENLSSFEQS